MRFVKLAQVICSVLIRWCWQLSRTVTAFFRGLRLEGHCFKLEYSTSKSVGVLPLFSSSPLTNFHCHHLLLDFLGGLIICDLSFDSSGRFMKWMLVNPLLCWHLKRLHIFLDMQSNIPHLPVPQFPQLHCIDKLSQPFSPSYKTMSLKSLSSRNILHLSYGGPPKLLLVEMLPAAAKSRALCWCSQGTCPPTDREVALIKCCTLTISDVCNVSSTWTKPSSGLTWTSRAPDRNEVVSVACGFKQQLSPTSTP